MTKLISEVWGFRVDGLTSLDQDDHKDIRELLLGRKVAKIADDHMELDNGTVVKIVANEGCGGCSSGWYSLDDLNECDNVITAVEFGGEERSTGDEDWEVENVYRVFVVAEDKRINLYAVSGDDGNGYYGTGYELLVRAK